jgi:hypothetical protein
VEHFRTRARKPALEIGREAMVFLNQRGRAALRQRPFRQRPQARTDFDQMILRRQLKLRDDPFGEILVVEKILSQVFAWTEVERGQGALEVGEFQWGKNG